MTVNKPWSVYHRRFERSEECRPHLYQRFDDGSPGWIPYLKLGEVKGTASYLCARLADCQRAVDWLNTNYPVPDPDWMREHWPEIVGQMAMFCVEW